ncbi:MAG: hypothetical protein IPK26_31915 [Planctomycetes bacterium]|nr:hypothetical protein [Planctomycetota bacterium]
MDRADYVGWGKANGSPGVRQITGVTFQSTDNDGSSAQSWSVVIFTEDSANRGYPLVTAPVATFGPFTNAVRPAGAAVVTPSRSPLRWFPFRMALMCSSACNPRLSFFFELTITRSIACPATRRAG